MWVAKRSSLSKNRLISLAQRGFTLIELIVVIIILGVMAVGISGFITLSTQTYLNVTERDELISSARFVVERLNRELRNAVPNSVRIKTQGSAQCLEFVPIKASSIYTELPVTPESSNELKLLPAAIITGGDFISVYPTKFSGDDIYKAGNNKRFAINNYEEPAGEKVATVTFGSNISFAEHSPTQRAYIFETPVAYCIANGEVRRYFGHVFSTAQQILNKDDDASVLMAENVIYSDNTFYLNNTTLRRNAVVQVKLTFDREGESLVFDNAVQILNVP